MKKACVIVLSVLFCSLFFTSCLSTNVTETTVTSDIETAQENTGLSVGDHITFGSYPQTDTDELLPIEWRVLEIKDGKALIISEYLLDTYVYNMEMSDVTWENCSLRKWLNGKFYDTVFSDSEKSLIQTVTIENSDNPLYGTPGGNNTEDKVFCLSLEEVQIYFKDTKDRMTAPTVYAIKRGAKTNEDNKLDNGMKTGWWWLRTPASSANRASDVDCYGNIDNVINKDRVDGDLVFAEGNCIRPAVWITLSDDILKAKV